MKNLNQYYMAIVLLVVLGGFTSCTSEYEERLVEGHQLVSRLKVIEVSDNYNANNHRETKIVEIQNEINFLAKVSGNEELFLATVFND